ncbi:hypothetical protein GCM10027347_52460 [Larkinella harenae]
MVTLQEIQHPDQPYFGRTITVTNEHADRLLDLEKRIGVQCWEVVPTVAAPDKTEAQTNATNARRSKG